MNTRDIVYQTVSVEGTDFPLDTLRRHVMHLFDAGQYRVLRYGDTVMLFRLMGDAWVAHLHALNSGHALLKHIRQGCRDVWAVIEDDKLFAPVMNPVIKRILVRAGWTSEGMCTPVHELFKLERARYVCTQ